MQNSSSVFLKVRVVGPNRRATEYAAQRIAKAFPLGRVDGKIVDGDRGDYLGFIDVVLSPEEVEA